MLFGRFIGLMEDQIGLTLLALKDHAVTCWSNNFALCAKWPIFEQTLIIHFMNGINN